MEFIAHRINTVEELKKLPKHFGLEIDLRDYGTRLVLEHDPFKVGEDLEPFLKEYDHGTLILNIKSERIEHRVLDLLKKYNVSDYFFLDSSFPMIKLLTSEGESKVAIRYSEFEGLDTIMNMKGKLDWVWVDCFTKLPIDNESYKLLKSAGFKICLVSPELQGQGEKIFEYKEYLAKEEIFFDAICTKVYNVEKWIK